jgi:hypothetical protein
VSSPCEKPSASRLRSVDSAGGFEVPLATGATAVCSVRMPARRPSTYASGPSPIVQWLCSSTGRGATAAMNAGTSSRTASGVSSPPGSFR